MIHVMVDWFLEIGMYLLGVALIPVVGLALACSGLWGDRSRGRPRCPKCWSDLSGSLPQLECSECGHAPGNVRRLYRNRRGWRRIVIGVVLVLLSAYPLTVVGAWYREQSSVRQLTRRGHSAGTSINTGPDWLVDRLPDCLAQLYDRVELVWLKQPGTDADMVACAKLRHLRRLGIFRRGAVTDAGLAHLRELTQLQRLDLRGTRLTDAGLVHLRGLSKLEWLDLHQTQVTDAGLAHLKELKQLQRLDLRGTQLTDAGLVHLQGLSKLAWLDLRQTQVTGAGLAHLRGLTLLAHLDLSGTQVADAGLVHLHGVPQLRRLFLSRTKVTDAGLVHLQGVAKLKRLDLDSTQVTEVGVVEMKQALPALDVAWDP